MEKLRIFTAAAETLPFDIYNPVKHSPSAGYRCSSPRRKKKKKKEKERKRLNNRGNGIPWNLDLL